jgi:hypothetical protein
MRAQKAQLWKAANRLDGTDAVAPGISSRSRGNAPANRGQRGRSPPFGLPVAANRLQ